VDAPQESEGLICSYIFDGRGDASEIGASGLTTEPPQVGFLWLHFDRQSDSAVEWLRESNIDQLVVDALLAEETRPRCTLYADGVLLNLRGVNLNPDANPEDMVSVRVWIEQHRVISNRRNRLLAVQDIRDAMATGDHLKGPGDLITRLCRNLLDRMEPTILDLADRADELEEQVLTSETDDIRKELAAIRHRAIRLRRFVVPQRDAIEQLRVLRTELFDDDNHNLLTEAANRVTRFAEELDSIRDRCGVIQDDLETRLSYQMNRTVYYLSVIAGIFLPLSFVAGMLGINVGGIPGEKSEWGFWAVCAILGAVGLFELWLFRRQKWI